MKYLAKNLQVLDLIEAESPESKVATDGADAVEDQGNCFLKDLQDAVESINSQPNGEDPAPTVKFKNGAVLSQVKVLEKIVRQDAELKLAYVAPGMADLNALNTLTQNNEQAAEEQKTEQNAETTAEGEQKNSEQDPADDAKGQTEVADNLETLFAIPRLSVVKLQVVDIWRQTRQFHCKYFDRNRRRKQLNLSTHNCRRNLVN